MLIDTDLVKVVCMDVVDVHIQLLSVGIVLLVLHHLLLLLIVVRLRLVEWLLALATLTTR